MNKKDLTERDICTKFITPDVGITTDTTTIRKLLEATLSEALAVSNDALRINLQN